MTAPLSPVESPFNMINALNGLGLNGGQVYIGIANEDPQTNPRAVYWDDAGTIPATQPLAVIGGYICRSGTPATAYVITSFSIRVLDSLGQLVFYQASVTPGDGSVGPAGPPGPVTIPQNIQSGDYTCILNDAGGQIFHPASDANNRTFTIPANASVVYDIGTTITFVNMSVNVLAIAITSDTLYLAGFGTTGSRSLARYGEATALKISDTEWLIAGSGLT